MKNKYYLHQTLVIAFVLLPIISLTAAMKQGESTTQPPDQNLAQEQKPENEESFSKEDDHGKIPLPRFFNFWQKERDSLVENGQEFHFDYSGEYLKSLDNMDGKKKQVYLDNVMLQLTVDLAKARVSNRGSFYISILGNSGGNITGDHLDNNRIGRIGDLQTASNIETNESIRLYECFLECQFLWGSMLMGLRDLNAGFYASEYAKLFSNSSFGIGPDISKNAPVSIFSVTAPAIEFKYKLAKDLLLKSAIFDGYPGTPDENRDGLGIRISSSEGFFSVFEIQKSDPFKLKNLPGSVSIGNWHHSGKFGNLVNVDAAGNAVQRRNNWGSYFVFNQKVYSCSEKTDRGVGVFIHGGGFTPKDRSLVERYLGFGLNLMGPFSNRPGDIFGIACNRADTSSSLSEASSILGNTSLTREKVIEIAYQAQITNYLTIKPNLQIIRNIGADPSRGKISVLGVRFNVVF